jgi:hypothetical protein
MLSIRYSYQTLIKLENFRQIFDKSSYKNFMKICPTGTEFVQADRRRTDRQTDVRTDRYDKANSRFLNSCERA